MESTDPEMTIGLPSGVGEATGDGWTGIALDGAGNFARAHPMMMTPSPTITVKPVQGPMLLTSSTLLRDSCVSPNRSCFGKG